MNPIIVTLLAGAGFIILFAIGEIMYHHYKVRVEYTRKFAHVSVGILTLTFPAYFITHWQVLALSFSFFIILIIARKFNQLQHIHAVERVTYGSFLYPPTVYGCFIFGDKMGFGQFFYIPILVMAISDPIAAITGLKWGKSITKKKNSKTFLGSLMFLVSAIIATLILQCSMLKYLSTPYFWFLIL
jgi:dolichol kinase